MAEPEFNHSTENWSFYAQKITSPTSGSSSGNLTVTATKNIILNSNNVIIGRNAGLTNQGTNAIAIGLNAGNSGQGTNAVAIGVQAGYTNQGSGAIAIGYQAGQTNQAINSIVINASGSGFSATQSSFYVSPIRGSTQSTILGYDANSKEITYYNMLNLGSQSTITPITTSAATVSATLTINFNNSYTSVINFPVTFTNTSGGSSIITINNYQLNNAIAGSQHTICFALTNASGSTGTIQWVFNGQTSFTTNVSSLKMNFTNITVPTTAGYAAGLIRYLVLTVAYDGSSYYMSGSQFS